MEEKAELSTDHPSEILEPVITSIEGEIDTENTAVDTNIENIEEAGICDEVGIDEDAGIDEDVVSGENVRTKDDAECSEHIVNSEGVGTGEDVEDVGTSENIGISESIGQNIETGDDKINEDLTGEDVEASNDTNTLISELNDVSLAVVASTETDSLLESLTSENTPADTEPPISDDQTAANATDSTDISTDISMPSLALSNETTPTPPEDMILEDKQEDMIIEQTQNSKDEGIKEGAHVLQTEQKDPVCSLEEELQRMHEGDPVSLQSESNKDNKQDNMEKENKSQIDGIHLEKNQKPIMKDSDLEEMLSADEVLQDPLIIKASQENLRHTDILVCGNCYEVFYFIEEFKNHKLSICSPASNVLANCIQESKSQVWAFTLWKNKQMKLQTEKNSTRSQWELYKNWCALNENDKNAWISAGQTLQYCQKIGTSKLTEIKVHKVQKDDEKDPLSLDGFGKNSNKENSSIDSSKSPLLEVKRTVINKPKAVPTVQKIQNDVDTNRAMRSVQSKDKSEYAVERIVAKRFNPKKKTWEYQIKWEHFSSDDNTWEPLSNLNHCKQMVDEFEEQLKKLKAEKAKQQALALAAKNSPKPKPEVKTATSAASSPATSTSFLNSGNRPQRTSKQKALDQVKAWCGNISDDENPTGVKRSRSPDSDESFEKRLKYEDSDDSETETKPKIQFRKIAPKPSTVTTTPIQVIKNGIGKNSPLPQNILIPDANGVVRINQKQLPSLSTGVYIMSKTAGIIKLDSNTSKVATSGGQTIVKVAPKIGQTQIKIMKKDGTSTQQIVQMSPKNIQQPTKAIKQHLARAKKLVTEVKPSHQVVKKTPDLVKRSAVLPKMDSDKKQMVIKKIPELVPKQTAKVLTTKSKDNDKEDESDDGLEELPFPDEIKIPEPEEEENAEFTLDPTTGKIAGVEYPDPEPEPIEEAKSDSSLDNIVKLAAADITEEDLKNEPQDSIDIEMHDVMEEDEEIKMIKTETQSLSEKRFTTTSASRPIVKMSVTPRKVTANPTSILNKALTGPQVVRRTIIGSSNRVPQQRVINQTVARSTQMTSPVVRQVNTYVRTKPLAPRPRFNIASEVPKFIRPNHNTSPKNVYSYSRPIVQNSPATRKIGNTSINRNSSMPIVNNQPKTQTKIIRTSSGIVQRIVSPVKKEPMLVRGQPERVERKVIPQKPKTVISMPSLISDDELLLTTKPTPQKQKSMPSPIHTLTAPEDHEQEEMEEEPTVAVVSEPSIAQHSMIQQEPEENVAAVADASAVNNVAPDMSSFTLADSENPIFITGDDGTVYQVAGQNEQGQTILLTQGSDGQQQCLLVTNEVAEAMETSATEEAPSQPEISMPEISPDVTEPLSVKTDPTENNDQVVAQVVRAEPPSPGGTHKVVVMLPDGNLMVTQVSPEEYASLELE